MLVTSLDPLFIQALIQLDRHCQQCNFRYAVNYSFKFCGTKRLNGYMGNVQNAISNRRGTKKYIRQKLGVAVQARRILDLYLLRINTWWMVLRQGSGLGWWVSVMALMLPHCLFTDKESLQTHQRCQTEAMLTHINQTHQKFTDKYCLLLSDSMSPSITAPAFSSLMVQTLSPHIYCSHRRGKKEL